VGAVVSHLLLIHNFSGAWETKFERAMWSIAVEWQIYFWFALVFLPLWRRFGLVAPVLFAWAYGLTSYYLHFGGTYSWMMGDFTLGMAAAIIAFWQKPSLMRLKARLPWYALASLFAAGAYLLLVMQRQFTLRHPSLHWLNVTCWGLGSGSEWPIDVLVGLATSCFILGSTYRLQQGLPDNRPLRLLHHRAVILLGTFSYSLYLIHTPIVIFLDHFSIRHQFSSNAYFFFLFSVGIGICLVAAYLFHLVFERPFMPTHLRKGQAKSLEQGLSQSRS